MDWAWLHPFTCDGATPTSGMVVYVPYMRIGLISIYNFFIGMVGLHWVNKVLLSSFYDEKEIQVDEEPY